MTEDHALVVFDEPALIGRAANLEAWRGYVERFPGYVIHPHEMADRDGTVAILGHTTGSHLGLPAEQEGEIVVLWLAEVVDGAVRSWRLTEPD